VLAYSDGLVFSRVGTGIAVPVAHDVDSERSHIAVVVSTAHKFLMLGVALQRSVLGFGNNFLQILRHSLVHLQVTEGLADVQQVAYFVVDADFGDVQIAEVFPGAAFADSAGIYCNAAGTLGLLYQGADPGFDAAVIACAEDVVVDTGYTAVESAADLYLVAGSVDADWWNLAEDGAVETDAAPGRYVPAEGIVVLESSLQKNC